MEHVAGLRCLVCGEVYAPGEVEYVCPRHGVDGNLDVLYDYERIGAGFSPKDAARSPEAGMWRYRPLLPVGAGSAAPPLLVGDTPLYPVPRLAAVLGLGPVWVKDDGRNPTASLKDRASAVAVVKAAEAGAGLITTASTGNAAAALAGLCAAAGRPSLIFVPVSAPPAKVAQLLAYGATVLAVRGTYDQAVELCLAGSADHGWYNRTTGFNPYMSEGKKTVAYEICEQLGWQVPDAVFVSVGDGCIIGGLHKGLRDLLALGWIDRLPRLYGVQAAGSNYLAEAWERGEDVLTKPPITAHTVADSISAGLPRDRLKAMAAVRETGGAFVTASDEEILAAIPALARGSGVFAEPAAAAAWAGLVGAADQGLVGPDDRVVVISTGSGLKDVASARRAAEEAGAAPIEIEANRESLERALADHGIGRGEA
ncbi:MAG TPA: threonine synthase [Acidimicrobiia bacterium]|nr:threonine synthase [Acidimicrobiia bacterium]